MEVVSIPKKLADEFVFNKHYSRRKSTFWAGFGLIEDNKVVGVVVYGQPSSPPLQRYAFKDRDFRLYELVRLVIQTETKNAASFLVGNSLKKLESPCAVVSYADTEYGHCGIVYQSTNWIYTGATVSHDHMYLIDGKRVHPISLRNRGISNPKQWARENNIETVKPSEKHRYFFFVGNKTEKREMLKKLNYPVIQNYPKGNQSRYDDGPTLDVDWV